MFDLEIHCNCENIYQKAVAKWRIDHPETIDLPYKDVVGMITLANLNRVDKLRLASEKHPTNPFYGLFNRRLYDPNRYLRNNDGRQPTEMVVTTAEETIPFDMTFIPTLAYDTLPLAKHNFKLKALNLLLEKAGHTTEEVLLLNEVLHTGSLSPFFNPLFKATSDLLPRFDPLCSDCPARIKGNCTPTVDNITDFEQLKQQNWGYVSIKRQLVFPENKHS